MLQRNAKKCSIKYTPDFSHELNKPHGNIILDASQENIVLQRMDIQGQNRLRGLI